MLLSLACNKLLAKDAPVPPAGEPGNVEAPTAEADEHGSKAEDKAQEAHPKPGRYGVPFAWEISPEEPLAKARTFMAEVLKANESFMKQGKAHFTPFAEAESPRATVLTCSDSRVQAAAWDSNPENDGYTVRNLGNQLATSLGSVEYGIGRLHTPVLLIIGHTGCAAIESVLEKKGKGKGPIADELSRLELPERHRHGRDSEDWSSLTKAVVANVDAQVADAVAHFAPYVQSGELTVVGAVYDFQNELDDGYGRLRLVNVNSNIEPSRVEAFQAAVKAGDKSQSAASLGQRPPQNPLSTLIDRTGRPLPGGPRATINAISILGSGDAMTDGTLGQPAPGQPLPGQPPPAQPPLRPGKLVPGTVDLEVAKGFRAPGTAAPPAAAPGPHGGEAPGSDHGHESKAAQSEAKKAAHGDEPSHGH